VVGGRQELLLCEHRARGRLEFDALLWRSDACPIRRYGLEELGIPLERRHGGRPSVPADALSEHLRLRDVAGPINSRHTAAHQAWYASVNALFAPFRKFRADYAVIPWATFTERGGARWPETKRSERAGIACEVTTYGIDDLDRAIAESERTAWSRCSRAGQGHILGRPSSASTPAS